MRMSTSTRDRRIVLVGILTAWVCAGAYYAAGWVWWAQLPAKTPWTPERATMFAILLASLSLAVGIAWAARTRHFVSNIDGSVPGQGSQLDLTLRYVSNTTEQLILFVIACAGICVFAPEFAIAILPVAGVWFVIARCVFAVGYVIHPLARSVGFAATFHPTLVLTAVAFWAALM